MKFARAVLFLILAFLGAVRLSADTDSGTNPANVLVGDLTFPRPDSWFWEAPDTKGKALSRFILPSESAKPGTTDVRFFINDNNASSGIAVWKAFFPQARPEDFIEEQVKVGNRQVTFFTVTGWYSAGTKSRPKPNHLFAGVIIPSGNQFVHVRMLGPKDEADRATKLFRKMIENAIRTKDAE